MSTRSWHFNFALLVGIRATKANGVSNKFVDLYPALHCKRDARANFSASDTAKSRPHTRAAPRRRECIGICTDISGCACLSSSSLLRSRQRAFDAHHKELSSLASRAAATGSHAQRDARQIITPMRRAPLRWLRLAVCCACLLGALAWQVVAGDRVAPLQGGCCERLCLNML